MRAHTGDWTEDSIDDQSGRTVLITGANSGLGLRSAVVLAGKGARVLLACRSAERGEQALATVRAAATAAAPELVPVDLGDLDSVRSAAETVRALTGDRLHVLLNNAGLMAPPKGTTKHGFETQFGINHLGHAALTWQLMPAVRGAGDGRVVTVSSMAATAGTLDFEDPNFERRRYNPAAAYGQAKLANQVFALELDRHLRAAKETVLSVAAHPGYTATGLASAMSRSRGNPLLRAVSTAATTLGDILIAQNVRMGTLPQLFAATAPGVHGGDYIGPRSLGGMRGHPTTVPPLAPARDERIGAALWDLTARLTGIAPDPA